MKKVFLILACFAVSIFGGVARSIIAPSDVASIEAVIASVMKCWSVPGLSLVIVKDGKTVLKEGYGLADIDGEVPATADTIFSIASMSKQMSTTLLAMLLEDKGISWRTKVKEIVPDFKMPSDYMTFETTIEDIVAHRTGVHNRLNDGQFTREQTYQRIRYLEPVNEFREELLYSGVLFSVVAKISETLGGESWEKLMAERVYKPLGMTSASFYDSTVIGNRSFAKPYMKERGGSLKYVDQSAAATVGTAGPAGSIMVSAGDMSKYMEFLVNGGKTLDGKTLLRKSSIQELFSPLMVLPQPWLGGYLQLPVTYYQRTLDAYAHGWMIGYYRDMKVIHHFGGLYGYNGLVSIFPDSSTGIYTAINGPSSRAAYIAILLIQNYITDVILGLDPWLNESTVCSYPSPWVEGVVPEDFMESNEPPTDINKDVAPARPLTDYVGTYGHFAYGNLTVFVNSTTTKLQLNYGPLSRFTLFATDTRDVFSVEVFGHLRFLQKDLSTKYNSMAAVIFDGIHDDVTIVSLSMFDSGPPISFVKDLKFSDAAHIPVKSDCNL